MSEDNGFVDLFDDMDVSEFTDTVEEANEESNEDDNEGRFY